MTSETNYRRALTPEAAHVLADLSRTARGFYRLDRQSPATRRAAALLVQLGAIRLDDEAGVRGWFSITDHGRQLLDRYQRDLADADDFTESRPWRWGHYLLVFVIGLAVGLILRGTL